jgi:hypothetical protein
MGTATAEERRLAIEAIVRKMEDAIHEAMSEARAALDRIGIKDGPVDPADTAALSGEQATVPTV